jgi:hypothetical protein
MSPVRRGVAFAAFLEKVLTTGGNSNHITKPNDALGTRLICRWHHGQIPRVHWRFSNLADQRDLQTTVLSSRFNESNIR